jgi:hypothetical protein
VETKAAAQGGAGSPIVGLHPEDVRHHKVNVGRTRAAEIILAARPDAQGYRIGTGPMERYCERSVGAGERRRLRSRALTVLPDLHD